jgi:hypothetical protein
VPFWPRMGEGERLVMSDHSGTVRDGIDATLASRVEGLSRWVDRLMLINVAVVALAIVAVFAKLSAVLETAVVLLVSISFAAVVIWIRYRRLWFRLYLPRDTVGIPDPNPHGVVDEESGSNRQYVRIRCSAWDGARRAWLWTLPWGIRIKPRGGPQLDLRWSDMVGAQLISMNMLRASDLLYVRIRTAPGLILLLTAREIRDWRAALVQAMHANGMAVSSY